MEAPKAHIHQVGSRMVHLVRERMAGSSEYLALVEGDGVCLANSFNDPSEADGWLENMFRQLHKDHVCGLGCISLPGSKFLADPARLNELVAVQDHRPH